METSNDDLNIPIMPELFVYLLKVNLAILLFYLVYRLWLRRLTFYTLNRFYLLFAFVFSAIYPLVNITKWFEKEQEIPVGVQYIILDWQGVEAVEFSAWPYLVWIFWILVALLVVRFLFRLVGLWQIHRESVPASWHFYQYRYVMRRIDPFSFWKNIYVHIDAHKDRELYDIFSHEQVHVEQLHTADTLMAEFFSMVCWFNPASWMMRYAVRENLEFITDRKVLRSGADKQSYQFSMLSLSTGDGSDNLVTHFNLKHIKNRIMMMNKKRSSYAHLSKYVFTIPLIVGSALVFSLSNAYESQTVDAVLPAVDRAEQVNQPDTLEKKLLVLVEDRKEVLTSDSNSTKVMPKLTIRGVKDGGKSPLIVVDGVVKSGISFDAEGGLSGIDTKDIESITILKDASASAIYGDRAKDGVILVVTKGSQTHGRDSKVVVTGFKEVVGSGTRTIAGGLRDSVSLKDSLSDTFPKERVITIRTRSTDNSGGKPIILIDGVEGDLSQLPAERIKSVVVLSATAELIKQYGSAATHGVVKIETKP